MGKDDVHSRANELMYINEKPRKYEPEKGDILEWNSIQIRVKRVTSGGSVLLENVEGDKRTSLDLAYGNQHSENGIPPGIQTWADMDFNPTPNDMVRLLENGWELKRRD
jgi:hypothetical protein